MATVNRENAMFAMRFEHVSAKNVDGTPVRAKRNGKTKTWKRRPDLFRIPVKHGLFKYFYIDNSNADEWNVVEEFSYKK
jgi:hypothetical protein